jgi:hypothetical protein
MLAIVLRTGFETSQGELMHTFLFSTEWVLSIYSKIMFGTNIWSHYLTYPCLSYISFIYKINQLFSYAARVGSCYCHVHCLAVPTFTECFFLLYMRWLCSTEFVIFPLHFRLLYDQVMRVLLSLFLFFFPLYPKTNRCVVLTRYDICVYR